MGIFGAELAVEPTQPAPRLKLGGLDGRQGPRPAVYAFFMAQQVQLGMWRLFSGEGAKQVG